MNQKFFRTKMLLVLLLGCLTVVAYGQDGQPKRKSPPATVKAKINGVAVTIDYSRPSKRGRQIWGGLVKYDKVWRTGANEATVFKLASSARINGELLKEGSYGLFTIPGKDKWTIIFNSDGKQWGASAYTASKDVLRVEVPVKYDNPSVEQFTIDIDNDGTVTLKWDTAVVSFKIS